MAVRFNAVVVGLGCVLNLALGFAEPASAVDAACVAQSPGDAGTWVAGRVHRVRFADGREFTVVGHDHEDRTNGDGSAERLRRTVGSARTAVSLHEAALVLTSENPKAAVDAGNDETYLRAYLREFPRTFVAVEATAATVRENLKSYAQVRLKLSEKMRKLGETGDVYAQAEAYALGPDFSLKLAEPTLFRDVSFVGVEDSTLDQAYARALAPLNRASSTLGGLKFDPDDAPKIGLFLNGLADRYPTYNPAVDDVSILREARVFKDYPKFSPYLSARLAMMRAMKARDQHIVREMLAQKRSGILLIGRAHFESITSLLRESCLGK